MINLKCETVGMKMEPGRGGIAPVPVQNWQISELDG